MENQFCPSCGSNVPEGAAFCGNCGAKMAQETTANQAPAPSEPTINEPTVTPEATPAAAAAPQQPVEAPQAEQPQTSGFAPGPQAGYAPQQPAQPGYGSAPQQPQQPGYGSAPQQPAQPGYGSAPQQPVQPGYGAPQAGQPAYGGGQPQGQSPYGAPQGQQPQYAPNTAQPQNQPYGQPIPGATPYGQAYAPVQPQAAKKKMKPLTLVLIILASLIVLGGIVFAGIKLFGGGSSSSPSGLTLEKMFELDPSWSRDKIESTYGKPDAIRTGDFEYYTYENVDINGQKGAIEIWFDDDDNADFAIWECDVDEDEVDAFVDGLISYMDKEYGTHEVDDDSSYSTDYSWENPKVDYGHLEIEVGKDPYSGKISITIWNFM